MNTNIVRRARGGFTLLELLVVITILAILAGGMIVAYDGFEDRAADSVISFNIKGVDQAIRHYLAINKTSPTAWDSLLFSTSGDGTDAVSLNLLSDELTDHLTTTTLTADDVESLTDAGITSALYVSGTASYSNSATTFSGLPNRVFDLVAGGGYGVLNTLTTGIQLPMVSDNVLLYQGAKLALGVNHRVVALGLGNNSTLVGGESIASLTEAPFSGEVERFEYGRFIALYHLASDTNGTAGFQDDEYHKAHLVAVIDASGHHYDKAVASASGQHSD